MLSLESLCLQHGSTASKELIFFLNVGSHGTKTGLQCCGCKTPIEEAFPSGPATAWWGPSLPPAPPPPLAPFPHQVILTSPSFSFLAWLGLGGA